VRNVRRVNEFTTIYAPISGWIFQKNINQGSAFDPQKKLFQIINLDRVWLEAKLFQNELEGLKQLHNFKVKLKGLQKDFNATKSLLYPMLDPKVATATLRLDIDNSEGLLKPGMYAKVHASADSASHLVIPRTAAMRKNGTWYAFLATEFKGEYEPVAIELKPLDTMHYIVIKGLKEDDSVVNNALFMMDSDAQINGIY
jgi:Cu(I)/Ag(I) efflux system membrane fusion protein